MANHGLDCTLEHISELCNYADEMDVDPYPDNNSELSNSVLLQANLVNSYEIGTVAPGRLSENPINNQQTIHGSSLPQQTNYWID